MWEIFFRLFWRNTNFQTSVYFPANRIPSGKKVYSRKDCSPGANSLLLRVNANFQAEAKYINRVASPASRRGERRLTFRALTLRYENKMHMNKYRNFI